MTKRGQSILEYTLIAILVIFGIVFMGGYVLRSVNAHFKLWDDGVQDSFTENLNQASVNVIPPIYSNCVCNPTPENCGSSTGTLCGANQREVDDICNIPGCDGKAGLSNCAVANDYCDCVSDAIPGQPACCAIPVYEGCGSIAIPGVCSSGGASCSTAADCPNNTACVPTLPAGVPCSTLGPNFPTGATCIPPPASSPYNCYYETASWSYQCGSNPSIECIPTDASACQPQCLGSLITGSQIACCSSTSGMLTSTGYNEVTDQSACGTCPNCNYYDKCKAFTDSTVSLPTKAAPPTGTKTVCGKDPNGTDMWCPTQDPTCGCSDGSAPKASNSSSCSGVSSCTCGGGLYCPSGATCDQCTTTSTPAPPNGTSISIACGSGWCPTGDVCLDIKSTEGCYKSKVAPKKSNCPGSGYCPSTPTTTCCTSTDTCSSSDCYAFDINPEICPTAGCGPGGTSSCVCGSSCCPNGFTCNSSNKCVFSTGPIACDDPSFGGTDCGTAGCCGPLMTGPNGTVVVINNVNVPQSCYNNLCYSPYLIPTPSAEATISVWGGGGAGGGSSCPGCSGGNDGGGGGGGGFAQYKYTNINPTSGLLIYPGKGGNGNINAAGGQAGDVSFVIENGGANGTYTFDSDTSNGDMFATGGLGGNSSQSTSDQTGGVGGHGYNGFPGTPTSLALMQDGHAGGSMGGGAWAKSQCGSNTCGSYQCSSPNVCCDTCRSYDAPDDTVGNGWYGNGGAAGGVYGTSPLSTNYNCSNLTDLTAKGTYSLQNVTSCQDGIIDNHASSADSVTGSGIDYIPQTAQASRPADQPGSTGFTPGCGGSSGRGSDVSGNGGSGVVLVCWQ